MSTEVFQDGQLVLTLAVGDDMSTDQPCPDCEGTLRVRLILPAVGHLQVELQHTIPRCAWVVDPAQPRLAFEALGIEIPVIEGNEGIVCKPH